MGEYPIPKGTKVAVYLRCSTVEQVNSLPDQEKAIDAIVKQDGLCITETYRDYGVSGATLDARPGLSKMLSDAGKSRFTHVLVYEPARMTRGGLGDFWSVVKQLRGMKVKIFDCDRQKNVTEKDGLEYSFEASKARESNIRHSKDITRTNYECVATRKSDPGRVPPYGYDRLRLDVNGKPVEQIRYNDDGTKSILDPETKEIRLTLGKSEEYRKIKSNRVILVPGEPKRIKTLQKAFHLSVSMGPVDIVNFFNNEDIPGPRGGRWNSSSLRSILENPVYLGRVEYGKTFKARYYKLGVNGPVELDDPDGEIVQGDNPEGQWFAEDERHEGLVTLEEWDAAQAAITARKNQDRKSVV